MGHVFVTGMYRSGTTLVEKVLHALPGVSVASQPLPLLYVAVKRAFLASLGHRDDHPLGHLFLEDRYTSQQWWRFLEAHELSRRRVEELLSDLAGAPGFWSPELLRRGHELGAGTLLELRHRAHRLLAGEHGRPQAPWTGSKEILCEEYVPYLLDRGERVVLVVRDPRAVLASVFLGVGPAYSGRARPVLFHLRTWRKSAAFALAYEEHPGLALVRYEDLLAGPDRVVERLAGLLELDEWAVPDLQRLRDQRGRPWEGNSSFAGPPGEAADGSLPEDVARFVEAVCRPELRALGYRVGAEAAGVPGDLREIAPVGDPAIPHDYSTDVGRLQEERDRLALLGTELSPTDARRWFIDPEAFLRLRAAVGLAGTGLRERAAGG